MVVQHHSGVRKLDFINAVKMLDMVKSAYMLLLVCGARTVGSGNGVLLRGDNKAAVPRVPGGVRNRA